MKAIATVKLTYDKAEGFDNIAELVSHIQSELKDHYFINEVGYEIENIVFENADGNRQEVFANDILYCKD